MTTFFTPKLTPPFELTAPALWFAFRDDKLLIDKNTIANPIPLLNHYKELNLVALNQHYIGTYYDQHCFALELDPARAIPSQMELCPLRQTYDIIGPELFNIAGRASQILMWDITHQFCSRCAAPMILKSSERAKVCPKCDLHSYPRISPSIIVIVEKGNDILLARSPHFRPGVYSALAGFVEPGESAEETVEREVFEEVGIRLKNIRYQQSQSWPFPHSLMLGFTADYASGDIQVDGVEIEDAGWYNIKNLPQLPMKSSIAHWLIGIYLKKHQGR